MGIKSSKEPEAAPTSLAEDRPEEPNEVARAEREALAELRRLTEYRSLMLSRFAHDLRTPLTAILGFAEILLDFEEMTESQKVLCERIQHSGRELQRTINLLSDLARLELNDKAVARREFSLLPTLEDLCAALSRQAKKKNVSLSCQVEDGAGSVVSDESKLGQVLFNFLAWAIARSPLDGQVTIAARMTGSRELEVTISDEGESFDVARRFDSPGAMAGGETQGLLGLGLNISQRLAETLGGVIVLENREPGGLSIILQLPAGTVGVS